MSEDIKNIRDIVRGWLELEPNGPAIVVSADDLHGVALSYFAHLVAAAEVERIEGKAVMLLSANGDSLMLSAPHADDERMIDMAARLIKAYHTLNDLIESVGNDLARKDQDNDDCSSGDETAKSSAKTPA